MGRAQLLSQLPITIVSDASGNVGIGTSTPNLTAANRRVVDINGTSESLLSLSTGGTNRGYISTNGSGLFVSSGAGDMTLQYSSTSNQIFLQGGTERGRFDVNGNLLLGRTTAGTPIDNTSGIALVPGGQIYGQCQYASGSPFYSNVHTAGANTVTNMQFARNGTYVGSIATNSSGTTSLVATSDARLKQDVVDAPSALPVLAAVKVRQFTWKSSGEITRFGVVAQELQEVLPDSVFEGTDTDDGEMKTPWGVDMSKAVPMLIKAIQELKADFDAYKASHP